MSLPSTAMRRRTRWAIVLSIVNITIWTVVGFPYWKALGLW
jgi:hypothetical protein